MIRSYSTTSEEASQSILHLRQDLLCDPPQPVSEAACQVNFQQYRNSPVSSATPALVILFCWTCRYASRATDYNLHPTSQKRINIKRRGRRTRTRIVTSIIVNRRTVNGRIIEDHAFVHGARASLPRCAGLLGLGSCKGGVDKPLRRSGQRRRKVGW